jgi:hypothetical protein
MVFERSEGDRLLAGAKIAARVGTVSIGVALGAYALSMLLPAYDFGNSSSVSYPPGVHQGWQAFVFGLLYGPWAILAWLANPLLWVSLILLVMNRGRWWPIALSTVAFACSNVGVVLWLQARQFLHQSDAIDVGPGVYAWIGSFGLAAFGAALRRRAVSLHQQNDAPARFEP